MPRPIASDASVSPRSLRCPIMNPYSWSAMAPCLLRRAVDHLPGVAQVAIQVGRYVGRFIMAQIRTGRAPTRPFRYFDKGNMAVVGKNFAILETHRIRLSGFATWLVWAFIHPMFLPQ